MNEAPSKAELLELKKAASSKKFLPELTPKGINKTAKQTHHRTHIVPKNVAPVSEEIDSILSPDFQRLVQNSSEMQRRADMD